STYARSSSKVTRRMGTSRTRRCRVLGGASSSRLTPVPSHELVLGRDLHRVAGSEGALFAGAERHAPAIAAAEARLAIALGARLIGLPRRRHLPQLDLDVLFLVAHDGDPLANLERDFLPAVVGDLDLDA